MKPEAQLGKNWVLPLRIALHVIGLVHDIFFAFVHQVVEPLLGEAERRTRTPQLGKDWKKLP